MEKGQNNFISKKHLLSYSLNQEMYNLYDHIEAIRKPLVIYGDLEPDLNDWE